MSDRLVHVVTPAGVDDPTRPSGGNHYDRRACDALRGLGWQVVEHPAPGAWPAPEDVHLRLLAARLAALPDGAVVLLDGLVGSAAPEVLVVEAARLRLVMLVHLPLGASDPAAGRREAAALDATRAVVTTSAWTRDRLGDWYGLDLARVWVARPGSDPAPLTAPQEPGGRLLCVAAATRAKGADVLVEALGCLAALPWTCTWAGRLDLDPPLVAALRDEARTRGIADRLRLTGPLDRAALASAYAAADLVVLPSRLETFGMVVTEALARGLPVVATEVGGVLEALGDAGAGALLPAADPEALAAALRAWLTEPALRERWRRAARRRRDGLDDWASTAGGIGSALEAAAELRLASIRHRG